MADQAARWQQKLDRDYPAGCVMSWPGDEQTIYQVPWVQVTGTAGLDPVVTWLVFGVDKRFGPARLLDSRPLQESPVLVTRVTLEDFSGPMLWSAVPPDSPLARMLASERARMVAQAGAVPLT